MKKIIGILIVLAVFAGCSNTPQKKVLTGPEIAFIWYQNVNRIIVAISENQLQNVKAVIEDKESEFNVNDVINRGLSSLGIAMIFDRQEIAEYLIEQKADVNFIEKNSKRTLLEMALDFGNFKFATLLVKNNAYTNMKTSKDIEMLDLLLSQSGKFYEYQEITKEEATIAGIDKMMKPLAGTATNFEKSGQKYRIENIAEKITYKKEVVTITIEPKEYLELAKLMIVPNKLQKYGNAVMKDSNIATVKANPYLKNLVAEFEKLKPEDKGIEIKN